MVVLAETLAVMAEATGVSRHGIAAAAIKRSEDQAGNGRFAVTVDAGDQQRVWNTPFQQLVLDALESLPVLSAYDIVELQRPGVSNFITVHIVPLILLRTRANRVLVEQDIIVHKVFGRP